MVKIFIVIVFFYISLFVFYSNSLACVPPEERQALIDFYNSTGGENWYNNDNWLNGDVCSWYGIKCEESHVVEIDFSLNELRGNIPESFGNLQNLSVLDLSDNQLICLPKSFCNLQNLSELDLSNNQLSSIPKSFGNLQNFSFLKFR